jgi:hypothetical protein
MNQLGKTNICETKIHRSLYLLHNTVRKFMNMEIEIQGDSYYFAL